MNTTKLLVAIIVLEALVLLGQWTGAGPLSVAHAQIPDAGAQRNQEIEELKSLNAKMDKLIATLESGKLQVRLATPDEKKDAGGND
jgi:hypothetical protein